MGHSSTCNQCTRPRKRAEASRYRDRNRSKVNAKQRRKRSAVDPYKRRCRSALQNAVADGKVKRPNSCSECGWVGPVHGHHKDYSRPMDVEWLCPICHGKRHRKD